ncbi:MAG: hypothetical protein CL910_08740 [Deltaproteobacteria bacterium]|nr:hypothetical protein [Deltaproteobacteria bacterium]
MRNHLPKLMVGALVAGSLVACAGQPVQRTQRRPIEALPLRIYSDTITVQDFRRVCDALARDLIVQPFIASSGRPPVVTIRSLQNKTELDLDLEIFQETVRVKLMQHARGAVLFRDDVSYRDIVEERLRQSENEIQITLTDTKVQKSRLQRLGALRIGAQPRRARTPPRAGGRAQHGPARSAEDRGGREPRRSRRGRSTSRHRLGETHGQPGAVARIRDRRNRRLPTAALPASHGRRARDACAAPAQLARQGPRCPGGRGPAPEGRAGPDRQHRLRASGRPAGPGFPDPVGARSPAAGQRNPGARDRHPGPAESHSRSHGQDGRGLDPEGPLELDPSAHTRRRRRGPRQRRRQGRAPRADLGRAARRPDRCRRDPARDLDDPHRRSHGDPGREDGRRPVQLRAGEHRHRPARGHQDRRPAVRRRLLVHGPVQPRPRPDGHLVLHRDGRGRSAEQHGDGERGLSPPRDPPHRDDGVDPDRPGAGARSAGPEHHDAGALRGRHGRRRGRDRYGHRRRPGGQRHLPDLREQRGDRRRPADRRRRDPADRRRGGRGELELHPEGPAGTDQDQGRSLRRQREPQPGRAERRRDLQAAGGSRAGQPDDHAGHADPGPWGDRGLHGDGSLHGRHHEGRHHRRRRDLDGQQSLHGRLPRQPRRDGDLRWQDGQRHGHGERRAAAAAGHLRPVARRPTRRALQHPLPPRRHGPGQLLRVHGRARGQPLPRQPGRAHPRRHPGGLVRRYRLRRRALRRLLLGGPEDRERPYDGALGLRRRRLRLPRAGALRAADDRRRTGQPDPARHAGLRNLAAQPRGLPRQLLRVRVGADRVRAQVRRQERLRARAQLLRPLGEDRRQQDHQPALALRERRVRLLPRSRRRGPGDRPRQQQRGDRPGGDAGRPRHHVGRLAARRDERGSLVGGAALELTRGRELRSVGQAFGHRGRGHDRGRRADRGQPGHLPPGPGAGSGRGRLLPRRGHDVRRQHARRDHRGDLESGRPLHRARPSRGRGFGDAYPERRLSGPHGQRGRGGAPPRGGRARSRAHDHLGRHRRCHGQRTHRGQRAGRQRGLRRELRRHGGGEVQAPVGRPRRGRTAAHRRELRQQLRRLPLPGDVPHRAPGERPGVLRGERWRQGQRQPHRALRLAARRHLRRHERERREERQECRPLPHRRHPRGGHPVGPADFRGDLPRHPLPGERRRVPSRDGHDRHLGQPGARAGLPRAEPEAARPGQAGGPALPPGWLATDRRDDGAHHRCEGQDRGRGRDDRPGGQRGERRAGHADRLRPGHDRAGRRPGGHPPAGAHPG